MQREIHSPPAPSRPRRPTTRCVRHAASSLVVPGRDVTPGSFPG